MEVINLPSTHTGFN